MPSSYLSDGRPPASPPAPRTSLAHPLTAPLLASADPEAWSALCTHPQARQGCSRPGGPALNPKKAWPSRHAGATCRRRGHRHGPGHEGPPRIVQGSSPLPLHTQRAKCRARVLASPSPQNKMPLWIPPLESQILKEQTPEGEKNAEPVIKPQLENTFDTELLYLQSLREPSITLHTGQLWHICNHSFIHSPTYYLLHIYLHLSCFLHWLLFQQKQNMANLPPRVSGNRWHPPPKVEDHPVSSPLGLGLTKTSVLLEVPYQLLTLSICWSFQGIIPIFTKIKVS